MKNSVMKALVAGVILTLAVGVSACQKKDESSLAVSKHDKRNEQIAKAVEQKVAPIVTPRLDALEVRVKRLEARTGRIEAEVKKGKAQFGVQ